MGIAKIKKVWEILIRGARTETMVQIRPRRAAIVSSMCGKHCTKRLSRCCRTACVLINWNRLYYTLRIQFVANVSYWWLNIKILKTLQRFLLKSLTGRNVWFCWGVNWWLIKARLSKTFNTPPTFAQNSYALLSRQENVVPLVLDQSVHQSDLYRH